MQYTWHKLREKLTRIALPSMLKRSYMNETETRDPEIPLTGEVGPDRRVPREEQGASEEGEPRRDTADTERNNRRSTDRPERADTRSWERKITDLREQADALHFWLVENSDLKSEDYEKKYVELMRLHGRLIDEAEGDHATIARVDQLVTPLRNSFFSTMSRTLGLSVPTAAETLKAAYQRAEAEAAPPPTEEALLQEFQLVPRDGNPIPEHDVRIKTHIAQLAEQLAKGGQTVEELQSMHYTLMQLQDRLFGEVIASSAPQSQAEADRQDESYRLQLQRISDQMGPATFYLAAALRARMDPIAYQEYIAATAESLARPYGPARQEEDVDRVYSSRQTPEQNLQRIGTLLGQTTDPAELDDLKQQLFRAYAADPNMSPQTARQYQNAIQFVDRRLATGREEGQLMYPRAVEKHRQFLPKEDAEKTPVTQIIQESVAEIEGMLKERIARGETISPKMLEDCNEYYNKLLRWAKVVVDSSVSHGGDLFVQEPRLRFFDEVNKQQDRLDDAGKVLDAEAMLENTKKLVEDFHLKEYFTGVELQKDQLFNGYGVPTDAFGFLKSMAEHYTSDKRHNVDYNPGGERQLVNLRGQVCIWNLLYLLRNEVNDIKFQDPRKPDLDYFNQMKFKGPMGQDEHVFSYIFREMKKKELRLSGDDSQGIQAQWGDGVDPNFELNSDLRYNVIYALGAANRYHQQQAKLEWQTGVGDIPKALKAYHADGFDAANYLGVVTTQASTDKGRAEYELTRGGVEGGVGGAVNRGLLAIWNYRFFFDDELRDKYSPQENHLYKTFGRRGTGAFHKELISQSIKQTVPARETYKEYIRDQIAEEIRKHEERYGAGSKEMADIRQIQTGLLSYLGVSNEEESALEEKRRKKQEHKDSVSVGLDFSEDLYKFRCQVEQKLSGKRRLSDKDKERIRAEVKGTIKSTIGTGFYAKLEHSLSPKQWGTIQPLLGAVDHLDVLDDVIDWDEAPITPDLEAKVKANEKLAIGFLKGLLGVKDINFFNESSPDGKLKNATQKAVYEGIGTGYKLNAVDKQFAGDEFWDLSWTWGVMARNDVNSIYSEATWGEFFGKNRIRKLGMGAERSGAGDIQSLGDVKQGLLPYFLSFMIDEEGAGKRSIHDVIARGSGDKIASIREGKLPLARLATNNQEQRDYAANAVDAAEKALGKIRKFNIDVEGFFQHTEYGWRMDYKKASELQDLYRDIQYLFTKGGIDWSTEIFDPEQGRVVSLLEKSFSPRVIMFIDKIGREKQQDGEFERKGTTFEKWKYSEGAAHGVLAAVVSSTIAAHVNPDSPYTRWDLPQVEGFINVVQYFYSQLIETENRRAGVPEYHKKNSFLSDKLINEMVGAYGQKLRGSAGSIEIMGLTDDLVAGLFMGLFAMLGVTAQNATSGLIKAA